MGEIYAMSNKFQKEEERDKRERAEICDQFDVYEWSTYVENRRKCLHVC